MAHSGFTTGYPGRSGCFKCNICGRKTRNVGQMSKNMCRHCDEWTMTENSLNDDGPHMTPQDRAEAEAYILKHKLAAAKLGGNREALGLPATTPKK